MEFLIYGSIMILALGVLTSISLLALSHILIAVPALYFLPKTNFREWSKSTWSLVALTFFIIISVFFNQDIAVNGYKPLSKSKYFIFGFLSIAPFSYYFKNYFNEKKISYLLYAFCISTSVATIYGIASNLTHLASASWRNGGFFGMMMNYAHNMAYFLIIICGLIVGRNEIKKYINLNFLYSVFVINLIGFFLTYTRGAWLGLFAGIPFLFFKVWHSNPYNYELCVNSHTKKLSLGLKGS